MSKRFKKILKHIKTLNIIKNAKLRQSYKQIKQRK